MVDQKDNSLSGGILEMQKNSVKELRKQDHLVRYVNQVRPGMLR